MKILAMIKYELLMLFRDKSAWISMLLMPIILIFILVNIDNRDDASETDAGEVESIEESIPIGICLSDQSEIADIFIGKLKDSNILEITETDIDELTNLVRDSKLIAGFVIDKDFSETFQEGSNPEIGVLKITTDADYYTVLGEMNAIFEKIIVEKMVYSNFDQTVAQLNYINKPELLENINTIIQDSMNDKPIINIKKINSESNIVSTHIENRVHYIIGMIVMFVMFTIMTGAGVILKEKKQNTWLRLLATPTGSPLILFGKVLGTFFIGWIQILILIIFGHFVFGINLGDSVLLTFILFTVYMFSIAGLGMFMASIIKSYAQMTSILTITIISTSMLSGCYWPVWMMPAFMQITARIFPQYWIIKALELTIGSRSAIETVILPIIILLGIGFGFLSLSIVLNNRKSSSNTILQ